MPDPNGYNGIYYGTVYDNETDDYWDLTLGADGKLYGFPDSRADGLAPREVAFVRGLQAGNPNWQPATDDSPYAPCRVACGWCWTHQCPAGRCEPPTDSGLDEDGRQFRAVITAEPPDPCRLAGGWCLTHEQPAHLCYEG